MQNRIVNKKRLFLHGKPILTDKEYNNEFSGKIIRNLFRILKKTE